MEQMIGAFGSTYRAIDIRTAAIKQKDVWIHSQSKQRKRSERRTQTETA